jgi:EAL domain-containing protein (putative c-di-GMP-specific phosphodiesterase class I)
VDKLKLEVTESLAFGDLDSSIRKLRVLRAHGFNISLDDFGTGNSSLNYLTKLPLTQLKIDKSFVDELPASHRDAMVAQTIIAMGRGLGLDVIAEGVETAAQRDFLVAHGCHGFQGYLFGRPLPVREFEAQVLAALAAAEV